MSPMNKGKIIIASDINVWPHEMETAKALAKAGMTVEFLRRSEEQRTTSADVMIDGIRWEMKAPKAGNARRIQRTLRDALHQSSCVIFDSRRMDQMPDAVVERELRKNFALLKSLQRLLFVNRRGDVIDIR